ncbi:MAG: hypothetical protein ACRCSK_06600 [Fusobacteriaceae bacterium]
MDYKCLKCGSTDYYVKTAIFPEKEAKFKISLGTYYMKTCANCGFVEMYAAAIVDREEKKERAKAEKNIEGTVGGKLNPEY